MIRPIACAALAALFSSCVGDVKTAPTAITVITTIKTPKVSTSTTIGISEFATTPDGKRSDQRTLTLVDTISNNNLQPKSIVYSGNGLFFAQNMMYRHNVSIFDRAGNEVATISDRVNLANFGIDGGVVQGSPVEAAFTSTGAYAYVSNYKMYGNGWNPIADDDCQGRDWDPSFVYRINTATVTEVQRILVGLHPRGIAVTSDSTRAYISVMGTSRIVILDLKAMTTTEIDSAGPTPRHLVLSADDTTLYVSNNHAGTVRAISTLTGELITQVHTGEQPRSMVLADDGASLYVVNYVDETLCKIRTSDFTIIQIVSTGLRPVGVTYDPVERRVWVANYSGSLSIYQDE